MAKPIPNPPPAKRHLARTARRGDGQKFVLAIHAGAGPMNRQNWTPEKRAEYRAALTRALEAGYKVLQVGGEAMDAAVAAVTILEDCPFFNAGKGASFNIVGKNELDASLMLSKPPASHPTVPSSRRGTGVLLLTRTKNPSHLARALYLAPSLSPHSILSGETAETIGSVHLGIETVDPSYFWTEASWREHRIGLGLPVDPIESPPSPDIRSEAKSGTDADSQGTRVGSLEDTQYQSADLMSKDTVGAVALDIRGCIATVTSTGGLTNKLVGRVGDSPLMGAGYWAEEWPRSRGRIQRVWDRLWGKPDQAGVGISGTGNGDHFIRQNTAVTIAHRMQYLNEPVHKAAQNVVDDMAKIGADCGIVAVDSQGNVALPLNTDGMHRGVIRPDGVPLTAIFFDDELSEL